MILRILKFLNRLEAFLLRKKKENFLVKKIADNYLVKSLFYKTKILEEELELSRKWNEYLES